MKKICSRLVSVQYAVSIICAFVLLAMIGWEVLARYVLKVSLMGIEEVMVFPMIWLYMLGGCNASYEKSHIECGILTLYIKKDRSKKIFECVKRTVCVIILAWLCYWGVYHFNYSRKTWKTGDITGAPLFYANIALTIGFFIMEIYAIRDIILAYWNLFRKESESEEVKA